MRDDPAGLLASANKAKQAKVKVVVGPSAAKSVAGQHLAWMLVNLLARQHALVSEVEVDCPAVPLLPRVALFAAKHALSDSLREVIDLVAVEPSVNAPQPQFVVVIGDGASDEEAEHTWYACADGWKWSLSSTPHAATTSSNTTAIGSYLAASMAAGEIFKRLRGLVRGQFVSDFAASAWSFESGRVDDWSRLAQGPELEGVDLGNLVLAGCGAVAQAALATLVASRAKFSAAAIDDDPIDATNLNRYVLSYYTNVDTPKAEVVESLLRAFGIEAWGIECKWDAFVTGVSPVPPQAPLWLKEAQRLSRFEVVLSGVDKNLPRHEIQNTLPGVLFGGSTDGLTAKAEVYSLEHGTACLKCFNPVENPIAIGRDRLNAAVKAGDVAIRALAREVHLSPEEVRRMAEATGCGELSPEDLKRFAAGAPDMSVGFVSLAAGTLQVAQLGRWQLSDVAEIAHKPKVVLAFGTGRIGRLSAAIEAGCACSPGHREGWQQIWSPSRLTQSDPRSTDPSVLGRNATDFDESASGLEAVLRGPG